MSHKSNNPQYIEDDDKEMLEMMKGESVLLDLQKEQSSNVRTLITAAAAIASVDLLAFSYLKEIDLGNWFLGSVVLLYLSSMIFAMFLTLANNAQVKVFLERSNMAKMASDLLNTPESRKIQGAEDYLLLAGASIQKVKKITATLERSSKMLFVGNILFILGLLVPVVGLVKLLIV
ncbi:MAG: hypothetical protein M1400_01635 [Patescibacteria group bacterium]|nr:hypothetical protein [Patescibacteria group bacterium]